jgi:arabinofuranosyltransferase
VGALAKEACPAGLIRDVPSTTPVNRGYPLPAALASAVACVIAVLGWKLLWFYTDDAFISFRYASNWVAGIGPTWNPPPFQHVEGYSNFLWVALLSAFWWVTGIEPPQVANIVLLLFGLGTLLLSSVWLANIIYRDNVHQRLANGLFVLALLLICTNNSFLTWLSSGLETSLFTFLTVCWASAYCGRGGRLESIMWPAAAWSASLSALTRPDGLLFWGLTVGSLLFCIGLLRRVQLARRTWLGVVIGLSIVPLHLLWRHYYYHDWLPNTYYAKVHAPWPTMGLRYLLSYAIEYALYVPLAALVIAAGVAGGRRLANNLSLGVATVGTGIATQVAYYTLIVGGDHFEYRIFHHVVPLSVTAVCATLATSASRYRTALFVLSLWLLLQSIIPWTHWYYSKELYTRRQTLSMIVPIADKVPAVLRPAVSVWDGLQASMIKHGVGTRHQEHKVFYLFQRATFPPRSVASVWPWSERNIFALGSVGVPGWVYSNVAIIDVAGVNDRLLAKSSYQLHPAKRLMAHDITASRRYLDCYQPNIRPSKEEVSNYVNVLGYRPVRPDISEGEFQPTTQPRIRSAPLTDAMLSACESYPWSAAELYADSSYWYSF